MRETVFNVAAAAFGGGFSFIYFNFQIHVIMQKGFKSVTVLC